MLQKICKVGAIIIVASLCFFIFLSDKAYEYSVITQAEEINMTIANEADIVIDLRDKKAYEEAHIEGSINIPYNDEGKLLLKYLKNNGYEGKNVFLICYSGKRSAEAFNLLVEQHFRSVHYIAIGFNEYCKQMGDEYIPSTGPCPCSLSQ